MLFHTAYIYIYNIHYTLCLQYCVFFVFVVNLQYFTSGHHEYYSEMTQVTQRTFLLTNLFVERAGALLYTHMRYYQYTVSQYPKLNITKQCWQCISPKFLELLHETLQTIRLVEWNLQIFNNRVIICVGTVTWSNRGPSCLQPVNARFEIEYHIPEKGKYETCLRTLISCLRIYIYVYI